MELLPGLCQGIVRVAVSYPFDYIRTNLQTQRYSSFHDYYKNNNITLRNIYRGVTLPLVTVPVDRAIQFSIFERMNKSTPLLVSSALSSVVSAIYSVPANYLATQIITQHKALTANTVLQFIKSTKQYTGFRVELLRSFFGAMTYITLYGGLRNNIQQKYHNYFLFGVLSSIGSWSILYPLDTLRVIKQTSLKAYPEIMKTMKISQYYKGFSIVLLRSVPSAGLGMVTYETVKRKLEELR
jgi:hypothetical protein